jgi:hypothetical protein
MPKLIRLYITSVALGFALSAVFLGLLIWQDVAGLGHLVLETASGYVAAIMLFVMNGIIFAGVQFAISVMQLAEHHDEPRGGVRAPHAQRLAAIKVVAKPRKKPNQQ